MNKYISGAILRTAYHVLTVIDICQINSMPLTMVSSEVKNNILRVDLSEPFTLFLDLADEGLSFGELKLILVPDWPLAMFKEHRDIMAKFHGWDKLPVPVAIIIEQPDKRLADLVCKFTDPKLAEPWPEDK